jgi:hypothetical protein
MLGGASQPLFRDIRKVIPFVNGRTRLFQWAGTEEGHYLVAAAENGIGVLNEETDEFLWKHEGSIQITAAQLSEHSPGNQKIIVGDSTGYVSEYFITTGEPGCSRLFDAPVEAVFPNGESRIIITRRGLSVTDNRYSEIKKITGDIITGVPFGKSAALLSSDGGLHLIRV